MTSWHSNNLRPGRYITARGTVRQIIRVFETYLDCELSFSGIAFGERMYGTSMVETDPKLDNSRGVSRVAEDAFSFASWANRHSALWEPDEVIT